MFGFSLGGKKKNQITSVNSLSPGITSAIFNVIGGPRSIAPMPQSAQRAFQLSTDPSSELNDFIEIIEADEALSARVIKIANSVYFDRGTPSSTVEHSVTVIGINELRCLLNANSLVEIFPSRHPARPQLWSNDIATALISRDLAKRIIPGKESVAFLAGLMHDVGKLLLVQRAAEMYSKVLQLVVAGTPFPEAEAEIFVFDHTEVGQLIAEKWNFPKEILAVIRNHHQEWPSDSALESQLTAIVKAADIFAHALGIGHPKNFNRVQVGFQSIIDQAWEAMHVAKDTREGQLQDFRRMYELERDLYERHS